MDVSHIMVEKRIHSDLGSLVGEAPSETHRQSSGPSDLIGADPFESEGIGFENSPRRWSARQDEPDFDEGAGKPMIASQSMDFPYPKPEEDEELRPQKNEIEGVAESATHNSDSNVDNLPPRSSTPPLGPGSPKATLTRWPTFGNHPPQQGTRTPSVDDIGGFHFNSLQSESAYNLNNSALSHSAYFTAESRSLTPASHSHSPSFQISTPFSRDENQAQTPAGKAEQLSPNIFGMGNSPRSQSFPEAAMGSQFNFMEVPPPLPPLNHPAFRQDLSEFGLVSNKGIPFPSYKNDNGKVARHASSLPSIARPRKTTRSETFFSTIARHTRVRARSSTAATSSAGQKADPSVVEPPKKSVHSRSRSKSSLTSTSRRSSAEYSARRASSVEKEGCWEVDVSKAIIGLAFGEGQGSKVKSTSAMTARSADGLAIQSEARGFNRPPSGEGVGLGSPFFLQDPYNRNFIDKRISNDPRTSARQGRQGYPVNSSTTTTTTKRKVNKSPRNENKAMTNAEQGVTPITGSSTQPATPDKGKEASSSGSANPSPPSTSSRRGAKTDTSNSLSRSRQPSPPSRKRIDTAQIFGSIEGSASLLSPPTLSVTAPTPIESPATPSSPTRRMHHKSTPTAPTQSILPPVIEKSHSSSSAKRKADEAGVGGDKTPPKDNTQNKTTFAPEPRGHRASAASTSSHAPSSFNRSKRVRLTNTSEVSGRSTGSRSGSRAGTLPIDESPNAKSTGSWSSRGSRTRPISVSSHAQGFRDSSVRDGPPLSPSTSQHGGRASRRSLSGASIPISALVSPHAPSVARSGTFHMRDPRKPAPVQSTPWTLSLPTQVEPGESRWAFDAWVARGGSPLHAWCFFIGFVFFPLWWIAAVIGIPRTRRLGGSDAEKGVILDDPQVEHDAKSWRLRCRVMAAVSIFTYIPFIVLVAIFAR